MYRIKWKKKYHIVGTVLNPNAPKLKIDFHNTHIHVPLISWLGTDTSINSDEVKLVLWAYFDLALTLINCHYVNQ